MMSGESGELKLRQIAERGVHGFPGEQGLQLLEDALGSARPHVLLMPVDWKVYAASRAGRTPQIARKLASAVNSQPASAQPAAAEMKPAERRRYLEEGVRAAVARILKIPAERIDARKPLGAMGLGSLLALELRNSLEALVDRPLSATLVWSYPTMEALVAHLAGPDAVEAAPLAAAQPQLDIGDVASISDDEAALLLMRRS
jgi:myxalamid-type polyketide synthase MxaE and MxaD